MGKHVQDPKNLLRTAIWRRCRAWAKIYKEQADSRLLIQSLLRGVEAGMQRQLGTLPAEARGAHTCPEGLISRAYYEGLRIGDGMPPAILALAR